MIRYYITTTKTDIFLNPHVLTEKFGRKEVHTRNLFSLKAHSRPTCARNPTCLTDFFPFFYLCYATCETIPITSLVSDVDLENEYSLYFFQKCNNDCTAY